MPLKIKFCNLVWNVYFLDGKTFNKKFDSETFAVTLFSNSNKTRGIYFRKKPSLSTIYHELIHVALSFSNFGNKDNNDEDNEEIVCCTLEKHLTNIVKLGKRIKDECR